MYNRLIKYIDKHGILFDNQYHGFRKNKSTSLALLDLIDKITLACPAYFKTRVLKYAAQARCLDNISN